MKLTTEQKAEMRKFQQDNYSAKNSGNRCIDCGAMIQRYSIRCRKCSCKGCLNPRWKEKTTTDGKKTPALHRWIERRKSKPIVCERCKLRKPIDLANISGDYKADINDFEWLCRGCHMKDDKRMEKLKLQSKKAGMNSLKNAKRNSNGRFGKRD